MKTASLLGLVLAVACAQGADAATYQYTSQPIIACETEYCVQMYGVGFRFSDHVVIDELLLPPGMLWNARVESRAVEDRQSQTGGKVVVTITSAKGTYREEQPWQFLPSPSKVMPYNSILGNLVWPDGSLNFETDENGSIVAWSGGGMMGGSNDYGIYGTRDNTGYDGAATGERTAGQGVWSGRSIYTPPASVPVPAALPLLTLALVALGLAARRRRG